MFSLPLPYLYLHNAVDATTTATTTITQITTTTTTIIIIKLCHRTAQNPVCWHQFCLQGQRSRSKVKVTLHQNAIASRVQHDTFPPSHFNFWLAGFL